MNGKEIAEYFKKKEAERKAIVIALAKEEEREEDLLEKELDYMEDRFTLNAQFVKYAE